MIYWLPLEKLEERYTSQWAVWFPEEFRRQGKSFITIEGSPLSDVVEVGTFLDINSTMAYKASQIQLVAELFYSKKVKDGDIFFLADTEMFGMEVTIKYLAQLNRINVKIYGFAHAGSYTYGDFVEPCAPFAHYIEMMWGTVFDKIFVGSEYHKTQLWTKRKIHDKRIIVTGNPYDIDGVRQLITPKKKINRVIHTNRPDWEKGPDITLSVFEALKSKHPDWEFVVTTSRACWGSGDLRQKALSLQANGVIKIYEGISKRRYLELLQESKVMTGNTLEENFGYCLLEAIMLDTIPVVENKFSHPELIPIRECLFDSVSHQMRLIEAAMVAPYSVSHHADKYKNSLKNIVENLI